VTTTPNPIAEISDPLVQAQIIDAGTTLGKGRGDLMGAAGTLINACHSLHRAMGWWQDPKTGLFIDRDPEELLALCHSEISEGLEGDRKGLLDDKLPDRPMLEVEIADCVVRLADLAGGLSLSTVPIHVLANAVYIAPEYAGEIGRVPVALNKIHRELSGSGPLASVIARSMLRCYMLGAALGLQVPTSLARKLIVNSQRADHKLANRALAGGKAY
jgi:hypothetical protein